MLVYNKNAPDGAFLLLYADLCAWVGTASERAFLDLFEANDTVFGGMDSEVAAGIGARTSNLGAAGLANQYFACRNLLTTITLDAETSASIVVDVLA